MTIESSLKLLIARSGNPPLNEKGIDKLTQFINKLVKENLEGFALNLTKEIQESHRKIMDDYL